MLDESENDLHTTRDIICELLEIAFHNILQARNLYPPAIFECKRKYGVIVYQSIHPGVNDYISRCIDAINFHLKRNQLKSVFLCFNSPEKILEKYTFQIDLFDFSFESDPFLVELERYLSDFCLNVHLFVDHLDKLPDDCSFSIHIQVSKRAHLELQQHLSQQDFLWVTSSISEISESSVIVPISNIKTKFIQMSVYLNRLY